MGGPLAVLAASSAFLLIGGVPFLFVGAAAAYLALRGRDAAAPVKDPELGLKAGYYFLFSLGVLFVHVGLVANGYDLIVDQALANPLFGPGGNNPAKPGQDPWYLTPVMRVGWALASAGLAVAAAFAVLIRLGTNDRRFPAARRVFVGFRLVLLGTAVVLAGTVVAIVQFQKQAPSTGPYEVALAVLAVCGPSLAVHVFLLKAVGRRPDYPSVAVARPAARPDREPDLAD